MPCQTWATTLIHCQTWATPRTWWTVTSWPGLTPTCRIGKTPPRPFIFIFRRWGQHIDKRGCVSFSQLYFDRTCVEMGPDCLNQLYDWPVELSKVGRRRRRRRGLGKCLSPENKEEGRHGNVLSKWAEVNVLHMDHTMEVLEQVISTDECTRVGS